MLSGFSFNYMAMNIIKFQNEPAMHWGKSQSLKGCTYSNIILGWLA